MNNIDRQYKELLEHLLHFGVKKTGRNGDTLSVFGWQIRHNMKEGFPLLTTKKMYFKGIVTELLWFLRGDTNIKYLVDNDCHIWDGDCFSNYQKITNHEIELNNSLVYHPDYNLTKGEFINRIKVDDEFAARWGDLGPIYGKQWRNWFYGDWWMNGSRPMVNENKIDQIQNLINELKTNPDSRRLMVSAWNVADLPVTDYRTDDELYEDYLKQNS